MQLVRCLQNRLVMQVQISDCIQTHIDLIYALSILIISGSVPNTLPQDVYERIMKRLEGKGIRIIVDAERDLLTKVLRYHPWLIKPNNHELGAIYGVTLRTQDEVIPYARKLQEEGAQNVLISMAGEGAVFISEKGEVFKSPAPKGTLVAGFVSGYLETEDFHKAFRMGLATGSASAFSPDLATRPEVEALLETF